MSYAMADSDCHERHNDVNFTCSLIKLDRLALSLKRQPFILDSSWTLLHFLVTWRRVTFLDGSWIFSSCSFVVPCMCLLGTQFYAVFWKIWQNRIVSAPLSRGLASPLRGILDPPLPVLFPTCRMTRYKSLCYLIIKIKIWKIVNILNVNTSMPHCCLSVGRSKWLLFGALDVWLHYYLPSRCPLDGRSLEKKHELF